MQHKFLLVLVELSLYSRFCSLKIETNISKDQCAYVTSFILSKSSTRMGFEPTRAEPNGLAVHRLNHSATSSWASGVIQLS